MTVPQIDSTGGPAPAPDEPCWFVATVAHPALEIRAGDLVRFEADPESSLEVMRAIPAEKSLFFWKAVDRGGFQRVADGQLTE